MNDLFTIRAKARNSDPRTSLEAADSIKSDRIRTSQARILSLLKEYGPMTDEGIFAVAGVMSDIRFSPSGARSRRHELVERGLVRDSGKRGKTVSGRSTIIWEIAP